MYTPWDEERAMYIYKQRKVEKRTFVDIGRELGITGNRVRQVYRQMDWSINRDNSDAWQKLKSQGSSLVEAYQGLKGTKNYGT